MKWIKEAEEEEGKFEWNEEVFKTDKGNNKIKTRFCILVLGIIFLSSIAEGGVLKVAKEGAKETCKAVNTATDFTSSFLDRFLMTAKPCAIYFGTDNSFLGGTEIDIWEIKNVRIVFGNAGVKWFAGVKYNDVPLASDLLKIFQKLQPQIVIDTDCNLGIGLSYVFQEE